MRLILSWACFFGLVSPLAADELIQTNQVRLTLAGAEKALAAAKAKAEEMKLKVNIAVVDDGGHLLAFARLDGARPGSAPTAMTKAYSAAVMRQPTGTAGPKDAPDHFLSLKLEHAAAASGGKITTLFGGIPIVVNGQVIGALGVGGATGEQDAVIAKAGADALLEALGKK